MAIATYKTYEKIKKSYKFAGDINGYSFPACLDDGEKKRPKTSFRGTSYGDAFDDAIGCIANIPTEKKPDQNLPPESPIIVAIDDSKFINTSWANPSEYYVGMKVCGDLGNIKKEIPSIVCYTPGQALDVFLSDRSFLDEWGRLAKFLHFDEFLIRRNGEIYIACKNLSLQCMTGRVEAWLVHNHPITGKSEYITKMGKIVSGVIKID